MTPRSPAPPDAPRPASDADLQRLRADVDDVDRQWLALLARRRALVQRIADHKRAHGLHAVDPEREAQMRAALHAHAHALQVPATVVDDVLEAVLRDGRAIVRALLDDAAHDIPR